MAFNFKKVQELHKQSKETVKDFGIAIFGKQTTLGLKYFDKQSVSSNLVERLAAHYDVPIGYFFDERPLSEHIRVGNIVKNNSVGVGNLNISDVGAMTVTIENLRADIEDKRKEIDWLKSQLELTLKHLVSENKSSEKFPQ